MNDPRSQTVYTGGSAGSFCYAVPSYRAIPSPYAVAATLDRIAYGILCVLIFSLPWEIGTGPRLIASLGLVVFAITFVRIIILPQARRLSELHYLLLAFAGWSSASILWTVDIDSTMTRVGTYAQLVLLAWVIWVLVDNEPRVLRLLQSYIFGTYVVAAGTIADALAGRSYGQMDDSLDGGGAPGSRYIMSGLNPNIAGQLLALSIPMSLYLLARPKVKPLTALLCWVQLVLCITTIFLTGSRGALLAAAPNIIIFPFIMARRTWWQRTLAIVAVSASIVCGTLLVPSQTWQRIYSLDTELTEGTMTHRTQIWEASLELFRDHPFLGVGANAHAEAAVKIIDRPLVAHNTFLSVLAELGVWGELLFLALLGAAFYCALQMPPLERTLWVVALLVWCISAGSTSLEYQKTTWLLFSLLAAHAYARRDTAPVPA